MVKSGEREYPIWPGEEDSFAEEAEPTGNGVYVRLEREDVYSVDRYFENQSGGMANADHTALAAGKNIYLGLRLFRTIPDPLVKWMFGICWNP